MKRRAMKKWIPKYTPYCYKIKAIIPGGGVKVKYCKWYKGMIHKDGYPTAYCKLLKEEDDLMLADGCKICPY